MDNETAMTIVRELRLATKALYDATNAISTMLGIEVPPVKTPGEPQKEETEPPKPEPLTLEKVRGVLAEKSRNGYTAEVRALLEKHGAAKLSDIDPKAYPALLADAEVLGNG